MQASVPSLEQQSSVIVIAQLLGSSTTDDLPFALQKDKHICTYIFFPLLFLILIYHPLFAHLFLLWTHAQFPIMYQKHCLF